MHASKKEQRGVIRFLATEGVGGRGMHQRMKAMYEVQSVSFKCCEMEHKREARVTGRRYSTWTGSSHHHTRNDCGSECFSLGQLKNHHGRDTLVTRY
ncbi:hypothetical protein TNCV_250071 [Trichonephila clavipes]|nr:hypothetical protein TNCV_250071 [Trichonephila clavipes]